jgi:hypothetical protein
VRDARIERDSSCHRTFEATYRKPAPEEKTVLIGRFGGAIHAAIEAH